jgi:hypothetical protein
VKLGDLVRVPSCEPDTYRSDGQLAAVGCKCWFCHHNSNRIGFVIGPAEDDLWEVAFDQGVYLLAEGEASVINEDG